MFLGHHLRCSRTYSSVACRMLPLTRLSLRQFTGCFYTLGDQASDSYELFDKSEKGKAEFFWWLGLVPKTLHFFGRAITSPVENARSYFFRKELGINTSNIVLGTLSLFVTAIAYTLFPVLLFNSPAVGTVLVAGIAKWGMPWLTNAISTIFAAFASELVCCRPQSSKLNFCISILAGRANSNEGCHSPSSCRWRKGC